MGITYLVVENLQFQMFVKKFLLPRFEVLSTYPTLTLKHTSPTNEALFQVFFQVNFEAQNHLEFKIQIHLEAHKQSQKTMFTTC